MTAEASNVSNRHASQKMRPTVNRLSDISKAQPNGKDDPYFGFTQINGNHSLRQAVPNAYVDYKARKRKGGKILFFNFDLAKEIGLIEKNHDHCLNLKLEKSILDAFSIVIINDYDLQKNTQFPDDEILPNPYMATRYLQLQHPDKRGTTSGDGRSIWNGEYTHNDITWDISSSGTGATRLSPATAIEGKFFKTGNKRVCYGNGYSSVDDGISTAVMSELLHKNEVQTERTLVIIEFQENSSINVRASKNLLRPSHFFNHLKQGNLDSLKKVVDYFIDRQISNEAWPKLTNRTRYDYFLEQMAKRFSSLSAQFESDYIFVWMDWDGDNVLATGGIIDYGSVRQFGLFHSEYRYDDVDRFSTKLTEQKYKARYMVQTFAQIHYFLTKGIKKNIKHFKNHPVLKQFDENFNFEMNRRLLVKVGFSNSDVKTLTRFFKKDVIAFRKSYTSFERAQSRRGIHNVPDGITSDAIFCMRKALTELPRVLLKHNFSQISTEDFLSLIKSSYAKKSDLIISPYRDQKVREFQKHYINLLKRISPSQSLTDIKHILLGVALRASIVNPQERVTGNGVLSVTETILKHRKKTKLREIQILIEKCLGGRTDLERTSKTVSKALKAAKEALLEESESI